MRCSREPGFTLIELVVAICIVAVLLTLTLPVYQRQLRDTRRSLAGATLLEVMMRQEQFFLDHKRYADTLTALSYPADPYAIDARGGAVQKDAVDRVYLIDLTTDSNTYTLVATPQLGQSADILCGALSLDSNGSRQAMGEGSQCW